MQGKICLLGTMALVAGMTMTGGAAQAVPAPIEGHPSGTAYISTGAIEDIYTTDGKLLKRVKGPVQIAGYATPAIATVVRHASTGCHKIRAWQAGFSLNGTVQWKYWVSTYSCWNTPKRLVTNVVNKALFTNVSQTFAVTHNLLASNRHFYNPASAWDPFPLPGLNSHSAYINYSKGEVEGTCSFPPFPTCWWRPWGTIRSLYNGNWSAKSGHPMNQSG